MAETQKQRNFGIDLLRIVAMLMVTMLHCIGYGGLLGSTMASPGKHVLVAGMQILAFSGVNCYALISGYVGIDRKVKYENLLELTVQVLFYALGITGIFLLVRPEVVEMKFLVKSALAPFYGVYWYFTAYFVMFFLLPYLNSYLNSISRAAYQRLNGTLMMLFSVLPILLCSDFSQVDGGYSILWLICLYTLGGYIRRFSLLSSWSGKKLIGGFFACGLFLWLFKIGMEILTSRVFGEPVLEDYFLAYHSPFVLLSAVFLFLAFRRFSPGKAGKAVIGFFAPAAFGVYLIQDHFLVRDYLLRDLMVKLGLPQISGALLIPAAIFVCAVVFLLCALIDRVRISLFRMLSVKKWCIAMVRFLEKKCCRFTDGSM